MGPVIPRGNAASRFWEQGGSRALRFFVIFLLPKRAGCDTLPRMKLKKPVSNAEETPQTASTGGATIAARFQLDIDPNAKKKAAGVGKTSTLIALLAALVALGLIGFAAWMMYSDWAVATVS